MEKELFRKLNNFKLTGTPNLTELRDRFCGCVIDNSKLESIGFSLIDGDDPNPWKLWVKYYNKKREGYALKVSIDGRLGALEHLQYFDLTEDWGFMAPVGYVRTSDVSKVMKKRIEAELSPLVQDRLPSQFDEAAKYYIELFVPNFEKRLIRSTNAHISKELIINSLICEFNEKNQFDRLAFVGTGLSKFIDLFTDLNFTIYFGCLLSVFKYEDIFIRSLRKALQSASEWNETDYFNIGYTIRVDYEKYELAFAVDSEAIKLFPDSKIIKMNLLHSGKYVLRDIACGEGEIYNAVSFGESILTMTKGVEIPHSFSIYLGLTYESAEKYDKAATQYQRLTEHESLCLDYQDILRRIKTKGYNSIEAKRSLSMKKFFHSVLSNVDDPLIGAINKIKFANRA